MAASSSQSRAAVLPNRRTASLAAVLVAMWYAGASQGNGAAYLLCFVLGSLALVSMMHAWTNLRGITLAADHIAPVFAGEEMAVTVEAQSLSRRPHFGLRLAGRPGKTVTPLPPLDATHPQRAELRMIAARRGIFRELPVRLSSSYPLGFFTARQDRLLTQTFHVYPAPAGTLPVPRVLSPTRQPQSGMRTTGDDYGGVRPWQPGESQRHIDWKAAARGQVLLTKQWTGETEEILCFDWQQLAGLETEARLSQLARWVVVAERGHDAYELRLPGKMHPAGRGSTHYHACLRALAEFTDAASPSGA